MVQLVCFGPCFLQGSQLFLAMPPQQSKISGKHVFLYLPSLKEHIPVFIIFFRPKLQELRGVEVAPPLSTGAKTYQLYHRKSRAKVSVLARGSRGGERGVPGRTLFPGDGSAKERFL
jgi:hypothetical protein